MKAIDYLNEQKFGYDHFIKLTSTGIEPDYDNIAQFAEDYCKINKENTLKNIRCNIPTCTNACLKGDKYCIGHRMMLDN